MFRGFSLIKKRGKKVCTHFYFSKRTIHYSDNVQKLNNSIFKKKLFLNKHQNVKQIFTFDRKKKQLSSNLLNRSSIISCSNLNPTENKPFLTIFGISTDYVNQFQVMKALREESSSFPGEQEQLPLTVNADQLAGVSGIHLQKQDWTSTHKHAQLRGETKRKSVFISHPFSI